MTLELTPVAPSEFDDYVQAAEVPFGAAVPEVDAAFWASLLEAERAFAVRDGGRIVGTAANLTMDLSVPGGGRVAMAGVTVVGVWPSHRRQGIASRLMARLHEDARERDEALAGLWASESRIYGRFGYGNAARMARLEVATAHGTFLDPVEAGDVVRIVEPDEAIALLLALHERERDRTPGMPSLSDTRARGMLSQDPEHWREGAGRRYLAALGDRGLLAYRIVQRWPDGSPDFLVRAEDLYAADAGAHATLWRYLLDLDLVSEVEARGRPLDDPLPYLLADPRRAKTTPSDSLWLRVLDVPRLLSSRRYGCDGAATLDVVDGAGLAGGRWRLEVEAGQAACSPASGAVADVTLPVASLGAACLGGTRLGVLHRAGRADEHTPGTLRRLDLMLSSDPLPWCPFVF